MLNGMPIDFRTIMSDAHYRTRAGSAFEQSQREKDKARAWTNAVGSLPSYGEKRKREVWSFGKRLGAVRAATR
jgi:hypothetical protein